MKKLLVVAMLSIGGCGGGDDQPAAMKGTVNASQARSTVTNAVGLRSAADSMNGANVASSALAFNASTQAIVAPAAPGAKALTVADIESIMQAQTQGGTQMCTATACTFKDYNTGGYTLNGNLNVAAAGDGKKLTWDLTMKGSGAGVPAASGFSFDYNGKGDITISATSLAGTVTTKTTTSGSAQGQSFSGGSESYVRFDAVVLSNGMATGGSLYARMTTTGQSGGQSASQSYEGTHSFASK